jgi:SCY1-like protein 2
VLDFSTIKNELFPVVAAVFSKTSSLGIKVRGLEAFVVLCGGTTDSITSSADDGLSGFAPQNGKKKEKSAISALDKYTMQEKIIPLIRGIKTKEPAVMLAALKVLQQVSSEADTEFIAMDILPILWNMSLGPLLDLRQFQAFMDLIKSLSTKVEQEHTKKLQELSGSNSGIKNAAGNDDFMSFGDLPAAFSSNANGGEDDDFERLVTGKYTTSTTASNAVAAGGWDAAPNAPAKPAPPAAPTFSWSTSPSPSPGPPSPGIGAMSALRPQAPSRTITPDLSRFDSLQPSTTQFSQPLQPVSSVFIQPPATQSSVNWQTAAAPSSSNIWASSSPTSTNSSFAPMVPAQQQRQTSFTGTQPSMSTSMGNLSMSQQQKSATPFSLPPPPTWSQQPQQPTQQQGWGAFSSAPLQGQGGSQGQGGQKKGLDAFESLL